MNYKPDNKCENHDDIILLAEIIMNNRYWQKLYVMRFFLISSNSSFILHLE
jgi:hypothetical protein